MKRLNPNSGHFASAARVARAAAAIAASVSAPRRSLAHRRSMPLLLLSLVAISQARAAEPGAQAPAKPAASAQKILEIRTDAKAFKNRVETLEIIPDGKGNIQSVRCPPNKLVPIQQLSDARNDGILMGTPGKVAGDVFPVSKLYPGALGYSEKTFPFDPEKGGFLTYKYLSLYAYFGKSYKNFYIEVRKDENGAWALYSYDPKKRQRIGKFNQMFLREGALSLGIGEVQVGWKDMPSAPSVQHVAHAKTTPAPMIIPIHARTTGESTNGMTLGSESIESLVTRNQKPGDRDALLYRRSSYPSFSHSTPSSSRLPTRGISFNPDGQ